MTQAHAAPWNGTPARSRFFDGISLLLPAGEAFLIGTMEAWLLGAAATLKPALHAEVERFLREERAHQKVHQRYNEAVVAERPQARATAERAARSADALFALPLKTRMAVAAALEHLTAVLSREMLEHRHLLVESASAQRRIWRWHAREELAHCHVAAEAAAHMGVGRSQRWLSHGLAALLLGYDLARFWFALCRCDVRAGVGRCRMLLDAGAFLVGGLPSLARMVIDGFHHARAPTRRLGPTARPDHDRTD